MYEKVYLINYQNKYFGFPSMKKSVIFAFKRRPIIEHVTNHIKYEGNHLDEIDPYRYLMKTHYNMNNNFTDHIIREDAIQIKEKRLYSLALTCNVNNMDVGLVDTVLDREDGDLELVVRKLKYKMPLDDQVVKFNLEMMLKM